jgi:hypothetical protein
MIKIAGLDLSVTASGIVIETLDDDFNIKDIEVYSWTPTKQWEQDHIPCLRSTDFSDKYERNLYYIEYICSKLTDCTYVSVEDYAMHADGKVFDLAEFEGGVKMRLYAEGKILRFYPPKSNKKFFSGNGNNNKLRMYDFGYKVWNEKKPDLSTLPEVKRADGVSPTSDIIDAYALCEFLRFELRLKNNKIALTDLTKEQQEVFTAKTKEMPNGLLVKKFLQKKK